MTRLSLTALSLAIALSGCRKGDTGATDDTAGSGSDAVDADGDGYFDLASGGDDCDDDNEAINPGATEYCDQVDNNCDGQIDDSASADASTWYTDGDDDNYGDEDGEGVSACDQPDGYVADHSDCDDNDSRFFPGAEEDDCTDPNDYNCDGSVGYVDSDGDGFAACEECNDNNSEINPGADEICHDAIDNNCDGRIDDETSADAITWCIDSDGDGYGNPAEKYLRVACDQPQGWVADCTDCNDIAPTANPAADEWCDGEDTNCNGTIDEPDAIDAVTWYFDSDGDEFGDPDIPQIACYQPKDYVDDDLDCDDEDSNINPAADEICNDGVDDDCDLLPDDEDGDLDISSAEIWFIDEDGDGYGNPETNIYACENPEGYSDNDQDCDDEDEFVNPGATEICDYVNNDCDAATDEAGAEDAVVWYEDWDGDGYGDVDSTTIACFQPEDYTDDFEDCDDELIDVNPGATEICNNGIDDNCDGDYGGCAMDAAAADTIWLGEAAGDDAGFSINDGGDLNSDGIDDLMISARGHDSDAGIVYVYYGPLSPEGAVSLADADLQITGDYSPALVGNSMSGGADVNDDGYQDILIGAPWIEEGGKTKRGGAYLFYGPIDATGEMSLADADSFMLGESKSNNETGLASTLLGDVNDDGYDDLAIGAYADDDSGSNTGTTYVVYGPVDGDLELADITDYLNGESDNDLSGARLANPGDVNGDGFDDVLLGVKKSDINGTDSGTVYLMHGPVTGQILLDAADIRLTGESASDLLGEAVNSAGDHNDDGYDDFLVSATGDDEGNTDAGAVYLFLGTNSYTFATGDDISAADVKFMGADEGQHLANSVDGDGDFDEDGWNDVAIGAENAIDGGGAWLFLGPFSGGTTVTTDDAYAAFFGDNTGDDMGSSILLSGDVTGSGQSLLLIGNPADSTVGTDAGAVYLISSISE